MPLVPAKCPECGGTINIDPGRKAAICEYCKQPFIVQEAINKYETTININNEIKANVVHVHESRAEDYIVKAGELIEYRGKEQDVVIPSNVSSIAPQVFKNSRIQSIVMPESLTCIGSSAFEQCKYLKKIVIEGAIEELESGVFTHCESLEEVIISKPFGIQTVGNFSVSGMFHESRNAEIVNYAGVKYQNLLSLVYYLYTGKMEYCYSIEKDRSGSIEIPDGVERIGGYGASVPQVGRYSTEYGSNAGIYKVVECIIPDTVRTIGSYAFSGQEHLIGIKIPKSVEVIGNHAFSGCSRIESVFVPGNVKTIGSFTFLGCTSLKEVIFEEGVNTIGEGAFRGCESLFKIVLPNTIKIIGDYAFREDPDTWGAPRPLNHISDVQAPIELIKSNITKFEPRSPFVQKMSRQFCPKCGGDYKGVFGKTCSRCGYKPK